MAWRIHLCTMKLDQHRCHLQSTQPSLLGSLGLNRYLVLVGGCSKELLSDRWLRQQQRKLSTTLGERNHIARFEIESLTAFLIVGGEIKRPQGLKSPWGSYGMCGGFYRRQQCDSGPLLGKDFVHRSRKAAHSSHKASGSCNAWIRPPREVAQRRAKIYQEPREL